MTLEEIDNCPHETPKYRHLVVQYCQGAGVDIGSQGIPVVPWAISFDLPVEDFLGYSGGKHPYGPIHLRGYADDLPFEDGSLDWVYSSHVLEDYPQEDQERVLREWARPIRTNGYLIVIVPEHLRWQHEVQVMGRVPNCSHKWEPSLGELSKHAEAIGLEVIEERMTALTDRDYSILMVAKKL